LGDAGEEEEAEGPKGPDPTLAIYTFDEVGSEYRDKVNGAGVERSN